MSKNILIGMALMLGYGLANYLLEKFNAPGFVSVATGFYLGMLYLKIAQLMSR